MRLLLVSMLLLCMVSPVCAEPLLTAVQQEASVWHVEGSGLKGVAGMTIDLTYDVAGLADPLVQPGEATVMAVMVPNTQKPGKVRIALVSSKPLEESGTVAILRFKGKGQGAGITSVTAEMIDAKGKPLKQTARLGAIKPIQQPGIRLELDKLPSSGKEGVLVRW